MNKYEKKAQKESYLAGRDTANLTTKQRIGKAAANTGLMLLAGLGGGFVGAGTGRWSLLTGLLVAGTGQFTGTPAVTAFGLGMATSNVFSPSVESVNGTEGNGKTKMEAAKERIKNYASGIKQKLFLDKILTSKKKDTATKETTTTTSESTSGMGEVKVFRYPQADKKDLSQMEKFEKELQKAAENYVQEQSAETPATPMTGMDETEQRIY
ncbi:MAG: hypothetical protein ACOZCO_10610 [Bacteroidota bacterium]